MCLLVGQQVQAGRPERSRRPAPRGRSRLPREPRVRASGTQSQPSATRARGRTGSTERPRHGPLAVVASQSTAGQAPGVPEREGGDPLSQGPTAGKETPGIPCVWRDLWERLWDHQASP